MPSRLRFDSDVSEMIYNADAPHTPASEIRTQKVALINNDDCTSTGARFRVGAQVRLDPPRSIQATALWQNIKSDAHHLADDEIRGIVVDVRNMMLQAEDDNENKVCDDDQNLVYSVVLHMPSMKANSTIPKLGDKVTMTLEAIMRFTGGVLKSKGCPEGAPPTFPIGVVHEVNSLQVKVSCIGNTECSWYDRNDIQVIENWESKFKQGLPEAWLCDIKCAFSSQIEHMCVEELFKSCPVHRIPVFQRRYCWSHHQWTELWHDMIRMRDTNQESDCHPLGRLLLRQRDDGTRLIIDGQQRLTTISLLLSSLRDRLRLLGDDQDVAFLEGLCGEGHLMPTLDDRVDFLRCLRETSPDGDGLLLQAKRVFATFASQLGMDECRELVTTLRRRFTFMVFILESDQRVQVLYHMMSKGWGSEGSTAGVEMSPVDFIRNFVLEHFAGEQMMREMHAQYWSPLELKIGSVENLECFFRTFLISQGFAEETTARCDLYDSFEAWWRAGMQSYQLGLPEYATVRLEEISAAVASDPPLKESHDSTYPACSNLVALGNVAALFA